MLDAYESWMVKLNLDYAQRDGLKPVVANLRAQGYDRVADEVERQYTKSSMKLQITQMSEVVIFDRQWRSAYRQGETISDTNDDIQTRAKSMKLQITQEAIEKAGRYRDNCSCLVATAFKLQTGKQAVSVSPMGVTVWSGKQGYEGSVVESYCFSEEDEDRVIETYRPEGNPRGEYLPNPRPDTKPFEITLWKECSRRRK